MTQSVDRIWDCQRGSGPVVAAALHAGHDVRDELLTYLALGRDERLREEDPFTDRWTTVASTRIIGRRSRFEVDLNRPRHAAVYRTPEDAWGLSVWKRALPDEAIARSLAEYDLFYEAMAELFTQLATQHRALVVLDLHSYNHRRSGPDQEPAPVAANPQINVGTGTLVDRGRWAPLIHRFRTDLQNYPFPGGELDVRENVRFYGGHFPQWTHTNFGQAACVLSIEVKKFFMDEWTGCADREQVEAVGQALEATVPGLVDQLRQV